MTVNITNEATVSDPVPTVLVVDDDAMVRGLETTILRSQGYRVLQAESAAAALRLAGKAVTIDLLITDYSMPEVNGLELARRFRVTHPETPVLMVSGSLPLLRDETENLDGVGLLAKPFSLDELIHKVRTLLAGAIPFPSRKRWCYD